MEISIGGTGKRDGLCEPKRVGLRWRWWCRTTVRTIGNHHFDDNKPNPLPILTLHLSNRWHLNVPVQRCPKFKHGFGISGLGSKSRERLGIIIYPCQSKTVFYCTEWAVNVVVSTVQPSHLFRPKKKKTSHLTCFSFF